VRPLACASLSLLFYVCSLSCACGAGECAAVPKSSAYQLRRGVAATSQQLSLALNERAAASKNCKSAFQVATHCSWRTTRRAPRLRGFSSCPPARLWCVRWLSARGSLLLHAAVFVAALRFSGRLVCRACAAVPSAAALRAAGFHPRHGRLHLHLAGFGAADWSLDNSTAQFRALRAPDVSMLRQAGSAFGVSQLVPCSLQRCQRGPAHHPVLSPLAPALPPSLSIAAVPHESWRLHAARLACRCKACRSRRDILHH